MDNIREITSAKKAILPVKIENRKIKTESNQEISIQTHELRKLIAKQIKKSIVAATSTKPKKSFREKVSEYIGLKNIIRKIIIGLIATTGGAIVTFKTSQIYGYINYISSVIQSRKPYNEMYDLCHTNKFLTIDDKNKFNKKRSDFDKSINKIFDSDTYSFATNLYGKEVSLEETLLSEKLLKINSTLKNCSDLKLNPNSLLLKQKDIQSDLVLSIITRWFPYFEFKKDENLNINYLNSIDNNILKEKPNTKS